MAKITRRKAIATVGAAIAATAPLPSEQVVDPGLQGQLEAFIHDLRHSNRNTTMHAVYLDRSETADQLEEIVGNAS